MTDTMAQPTPGLEVTAPDDTMELSSEFGARMQDDIDIDIDLTGSGVGSPAQRDDYMIADYNEIDMDATPVGNNTNHDDDIMADDSKIEYDLTGLEGVVPDEELRDISDLGQDESGPQGGQSDIYEFGSEQHNTTQDYIASAARLDHSAEYKINENQFEEDLLDYDDEEEETADVEQAYLESQNQNAHNKASVAETGTAPTLAPSHGSFVAEGSAKFGENAPSLEPSDLTSSQSTIKPLDEPTTHQNVHKNGSQDDTRSSAPFQQQGSGLLTVSGEDDRPTSVLELAYEDIAANEEDSYHKEEHVLAAEADIRELLEAEVTIDDNLSALNATTNLTGEDEIEWPNEDGEEDVEPKDTSHIRNTLAESDIGPNSDPLPISTIVSYEGTEYFLFRTSSQESHDMYFLSDESFAKKSLYDLLAACREVLSESISDEAELEIDILELGLCINQSSVYAHVNTLQHVIDLYIQLTKLDGTYDPEALHASLTAKTSFSRRWTNLQQAANSGKGLSQLEFLQDFEPHDDNVGDHWPEDSGRASLDQDDTSSNDLTHDEQEHHVHEHKKHELVDSVNGEDAGGIPVVSAQEQHLGYPVPDHHHKAEGEGEVRSYQGSDSERASGSISGQSSNVASKASRAVEVQRSEAKQGETESGFDAIEDLLDDEDDKVGPADDDRNRGEHLDLQSIGETHVRHKPEEGQEDITRSGNLTTEVYDDPREAGGQNQDIDEIDYNEAEEYHQATETNDQDTGNEDAEELFLFDEDTTAVDDGAHDEGVLGLDYAEEQKPNMTLTSGAEDHQSGRTVHDEQEHVKGQDNANDDIFDEINFDYEDELPEFQDGDVPEAEIKASLNLQAKRSWDEHIADSLKDFDEQDPKRIRSEDHAA